MAANNYPIFDETKGVAVGQVTTADTSRTSPSTVTTVFSAGADGSRIYLIRVVAVGTTTAGAVRLWVHDGSNNRLYKELLVTAITPSTSIEVWWTEFMPSGPDQLILPTGYSLRATTHNTETFNVFVHYGSY